MGGSAISRIYSENNNVKMQIYEKQERMDVGRAELLTRADLISNALMLELLRRFPLLKYDFRNVYFEVITEEKFAKINNREMDRYRADNYELWMGLRELISSMPSWRIPLGRIVIWIDPLDGTQEFTERLTEYVTVMACITIDGKPFVGAIHSPFNNETILGMVDHGVFSSKDGKLLEGNYHTKKQNHKVLISRSHAGNISLKIEEAFIVENLRYTVEPAGGTGYKTLRLIRQTADLYVHSTAIKKWDICACDAIAKAAGGALLSLVDGLPIDYSVKLKNNVNIGERIQFDPVHKGGILMALDAPYSFYEPEGDEVEISNRNQNPPSNDITRRQPNITEPNEDETELNKSKNQRLGSNVIKFRPFGILEPQSARIARKNIQSIIPLLCDAANIRYKVLALDKEMNRLSD
uniref:Myo-inositol monophosphatase A3 n=1 Tax=Meloidogyne javanica TaxID=6303 RepID=A0A915N5T7_MELJA